MSLLDAITREAIGDDPRLSYGFAILRGLQSKHVYQGTVPAHIVAKRRARNRVAKASRKANRA